MKIFRFIFFILFSIILGCSNNDSPAFDPNDWDADGVSNEREYFDNTDPNDPCSVNTSSQYPQNIPESWKLLDCDGDGVTNQQELEDITSLFNLCDFKPENQNLQIVSEGWKNSDCDEDGVTNQQELLDKTDLKDNCSLLVSSIKLTPKEYWLKLDCDGDGRTNEQEISDNTSPLDPNDFSGSGDKILFIKSGNGYTYHFIQNGTLLDKIVRNSDNSIITYFEYNTDKKLIKVTIDDNSNDEIIISFTYNNNEIIKVLRNKGIEQEIYNLVYDSNTIYSYKDVLPNNTFYKKYTFNANNKIIKEEHNYNSGEYYQETFTYNPNGDIKYSSFSVGQYSGNYSYSYIDNVKNPMKIAFNNIYIQYLLINEILTKSFNIKLGVFSSKFTDSMSRYTPPTSHTFSYGVKNFQTNGYPTLGYHSDFSVYYDIEYYYEN